MTDNASGATRRPFPLGELHRPSAVTCRAAERPPLVMLNRLDPYQRNARAVLDLIASRVPVWQPVEPGTVKPGMVLKRTDRDGGYTVFTVKHVETYGDKYRRARGTNGFYVDLNEHGFTWEVDPRTVPAQPEDPRIKRAHAIIPALQRVKHVPLGGDLLPAALEAIDAIDALEADR